MDLKLPDAMSIDYLSDKPRWFAICTNPKQEDRAYYNLRASSVECFNPKIQESRRNQFTGAVTLIARPLFPRYIFACFSVRSALRTVRFTRGVLKVVSFNFKPAPIDNEVIELMKSRVGKDGFLKVGEALKPGDKVRIKDGPWIAMVGVIERNTQASERVQILLTAISYQGRLMIERQLVEKIC
jgi:transcriptional antiterminator RfaH